MRAGRPVVIAVAMIALLAGSAFAQVPSGDDPRVGSKSDGLRAEAPGSEMESVWSAEMVVGEPGQSRGHDYLGYSFFKRSGALEPTGFDYGGERVSVLALAYSATAQMLGLAASVELADELVLQVGGVEFEVGEADVRRSPHVSHVAYEWDTSELDWAVGDTVEVALAAPPPAILDDSELPARPNVVLILADDLGWGDVASNNPDSAMTTPNIDSIAADGVNFTDAHSPSSLCSPTRYGLLTGRYAWRTWLTWGTLGGSDRPLIGSDQPTLATLLRDRGYRTAAVGKWHLGMDFARLPSQGEIGVTAENRGIDFSADILDGPLDHGFDEFFGTSANLAWEPHVYIRGRGFTADPSTYSPSDAGFYEFGEVLDRLTDEAVDFIERGALSDDPFFLYLPLHTPHFPLVPSGEFAGKTGLGPYADVVAQADWTVGQVLEALERTGAYDDTLVIFTSDNGSYKGGIPVPNHHTHRPNGGWSGLKSTIYEGGHRIPLMMRWPSALKPGSAVDATVSLTDLYATLSDIVGEEPALGTAQDSVTMLPILRGHATERGEPVVHHSGGGMFAIRDGEWKLVFGNGNGSHRGSNSGVPFEQPWQLYNLEQNSRESRSNRIPTEEHPELVAELQAALERIRAAGDETLSSDATLRSLTVSGIDIGPFAPTDYQYSASVNLDVRRTSVVAIPSAVDADVTIGSGQEVGWRGRLEFDLAEGANTVQTIVTSPNGQATRAYTVTITRTEAADTSKAQGSADAQESLEVRVSASPLTAEVSGVPSAHDGQSPVSFELAFSEEPSLSYVTLRDRAFDVAGGEVVGARRLDRPSNLRWEITVVPAGRADVVVVLAPTADCAAIGAICTGGGEPLSNRIEFSVAGP